MTRNIYLLAIFTLLLGIATGCGKEGSLTPSNVRENYFTPDPSATDAESVLRRNFYDTENIYLLFNDTLRHELAGTDRYGDDVFLTETVDLGWTMTGYGSYPFSFNYLSGMAAKNAAVDFVKTHILSRLGATLKPFSVLLVETIDTWRYRNNVWQRYQSYKVYNGSRCTAIALRGVEDMDEEELEEFGITVMFAILVPKIKNSEDEGLAEFFRQSSRYYDYSKSSFGVPAAWDDEPVRERGFLYDEYRSYFPDKDEDIEAYLDALFNMTTDEFAAEFGVYPVIMKKYGLFKEALLSMGLVL